MLSHQVIVVLSYSEYRLCAYFSFPLNIAPVKSAPLKLVLTKIRYYACLSSAVGSVWWAN